MLNYEVDKLADAIDPNADLDFDFSDLDNPFRDDGRHTRQTPYQPDEDDDSADLDPSKQGL